MVRKKLKLPSGLDACVQTTKQIILHSHRERFCEDWIDRDIKIGKKGKRLIWEN